MHALPLPTCPGCSRPVPNPGQLVNCPDTEREWDWDWDCALMLLAQVTAAPQAPSLPLDLDWVPVRLPGCPGCGESPHSPYSVDHCVDRAERFWHHECAREVLGKWPS